LYSAGINCDLIKVIPLFGIIIEKWSLYLTFVKEKYRPEINILMFIALVPGRGQSHCPKPAEIDTRLRSYCAFLQQKFRYIYARPFKMELIRCPETSVTNYQSTLQSEHLQG
jgi:hypothetical protein